ncbi:glycosyltransferase [Clostridium chromiireducens]|uniref:Glycosyltransferase n=1 Tax=Clostridium chromiireducens TaxID=225345 RepID=A0A964W1L2_9CLOT|nr:glycosyltransferase family 4 protein [Clostridium chromiireducens]MVX63173.1 glycosyltransferase [Clostridium chromiireducens]
MTNRTEELIISSEESTSPRPLRIVQVAPDYYPVPPLNYGGIERVVYNLTEQLVKLGHEVYLYAPKGSKSSATIINYEHIMPNPQNIVDFVVKTLPDNIDIIHDHTHASVIGRKKLTIPTVCTIHSCTYNDVDYPIYVSKRALEVCGKNNGLLVYHGIDINEYEFSDEKDDYLLFLGAVSSHKGPDYAIEVAEKTNQKLIIAGPVFNREYYAKELEPRIQNNPNIHYIGEVGGQDRQNIFKKAKCFLFPTCCEEPFGLVMIEAMACGTPVLAFPNGAVPEVLRGFPNLICSSVDEMVLKINSNEFPESKLLREYVVNNFTIDIMAREYVNIYNKILTEEVNYNYGNELKQNGKFTNAIEYYNKFLLSSNLPQRHKIKLCFEIADLYFNLNDFRKEREFNLKSFEYDTPRAEFCCRIGYQFLQNNEIDKAIFWYTLATQLEKPILKEEILSECCWTWLPHIQLCVCYYKTGNYQKSYTHNEIARSFIPTDERILYNKELLERILKNDR